MYTMFSFIFVTFVGSVVGFDGRLQLSTEKRESIRRQMSDRIKSYSDITEERTMTSGTGCVLTEVQLRDAVVNARTEGPGYARIDLCSRNIMFDLPFGLDISNKWLDIRCGLRQGRCALDGQGVIEIIFGFDANIRMDRVDFVNGVDTIAPIFFFTSNVDISRSSFLNNSGIYSALVIFGGDFLKLRDVTFFQNSAEDANVYLYNVTKTTIIATSFTNNKESALYVEEGSTLDLNRVTFERTFATKMGSYYPATVYIDNIAKTEFSGSLFKNNSIIPLVVRRGGSISIVNTVFESNYNNEDVSSAILVARTTVALQRVSFFNNVLNEKEGNALGIFFSLVTLVGCRFVNNTMPAMSSSVRVYDGGDLFGDGGFAGTDTSLSCTNTRLCDGFPSNTTIVDQFSQQFNAPSCKVNFRC